MTQHQHQHNELFSSTHTNSKHQRHIMSCSFLQHSQSSTMENLIWNPLLPLDFNGSSRFFAELRISLIVLVIILAWIFLSWYRQHYRKRHRRSSDECPSHKRAPVRRRDPATLPQKPRYSRLPSHRKSAFTQGISDHLSMDHIYLPFGSFLWGMIFIWPAVVFSALRGVIPLVIRSKLQKMGYVEPAPHDPAHVCYQFIMEGTIALYFLDFDSAGNAEFHIDGVPIVNNKGKLEFNHLKLTLDLKSKRLIFAVLDDDEELSAKECLTVLFIYLSISHHTKIHSLANWAVSLEAMSNNFVARNGISTVMYNNFGYTGFRDLYPTLQLLGLLPYDLHPNDLKAIFDHGITSGIPEHSQILKLAKHSPFVDFIIKVRRIFIAEFAKHRTSFPKCNVEALFAGTVLHSLDHSAASFHVPDILWFDVDCPKFGLMAEMSRIVRACFVDDLTGVLFHKSFRDCGHPFYESVYEKAAKLDKRFADQMDTCIIK